MSLAYGAFSGVDRPAVESHPRRSRRRVVTVSAIAAVALIVVVVVLTRGRPNVFERAHEACGTPFGATLADGGRTLILDMKGEEETTGISVGDLVCYLYELDAPTEATALMDSTRALDGVQSYEWAGITAKWTYHPDDGLDVILSM